ncbi:hypothetical protein [Aeromonas australiensis]|uniref:hypothetical protein n=1 Tax=Aeromonas australiensis TaxID=1114880 RepID=UPI0009E2B163|nr:hypothetical protein [Aeromonas australiensis]
MAAPTPSVNLNPALQEPLSQGNCGIRDKGQHLTFFTKGDDATLERYGQPTLTCLENPTKG